MRTGLNPPEKMRLEAFLSAYPAEIALLAGQTCALIRQVMPETLMQLDKPANLIAFGTDHSYKALMCGVTMHKAHVNLMFARGANLPDADGLLTGSGKKARHIKISVIEDINQPGVKHLLEAALAMHEEGS